MSEDLTKLIRAGTPTITIETLDEPHALKLVRNAANELGKSILEWSVTEGLREFDIATGRYGRSLVPPGKPASAMKHIVEHPRACLLVLKDLSPHSTNADVFRLIRDLQDPELKPRPTVILIDASSLPDAVRRLAVHFDVPWPTTEELEVIVKETYQRIRRQELTEVKGDITRREMEQLVSALRGLSPVEAERAVADAIYDDYALTGADLPKIIESKRTLLGSMGSLEAIATDFSTDDIGGLANLQSWLKQRRGGYTQRAHEYGLEPPRGVLMLGVPGCGKSLCAKIVAADWGVGLLRLDPGVLYQKFIGESESQLRRALAQAEAMAPVVLWIDEIEKAFASASGQSSDGGLSRRMFGTLLAWMQDHRHPIFIIATANDVTSLPPELMRKGRFDEIFFVDLPSSEAREQILEVHLRRRNRDPAAFDLSALAAACDGFSGSEIEQAIISALYSSFKENRELSAQDILREIENTQPLSVLQKEKIDNLRAWARDRCVPAN